MALLLAEERFLKIKQTMEEEQNQPEVIQELLLKLMDDLQILKGIQQEKEKPAAQSFIPYWNFSMIDDEEARENFMKDICTFLRKLSRIPFGVTPKLKFLKDVQNISEEFSEYINCPSWNRPLFYDYDDDDYTIIYSKPKAITPDLLIEEPDNSLSMGDEHLDTISSVEILVPIPSEFEGISKDTCDVPVCENPSTFDALNDHSEILSDSNDDGTSSDDNYFEDIEYVSLEEVNNGQEEKEFDLEDIFQIQDIILREKLVNISRLITNIESFNDNPTPDRVLKSPSLVPISVTDTIIRKRREVAVPLLMLITHPSSSPIPVVDSDFLIEEVDTFLVSEDSIPPGIESDFDSEEDIIFLDDLLNDDPILEYERFTFDIEPGTAVINNFDELNEDEYFDPEGGEIIFSLNIKDDESFTFVIQTFLPFLTYPVDSPLLLSTGSEDIIFNPNIST
ncbi:hypothetical protein Tco_1275409 [Tanacetum coccineum]